MKRPADLFYFSSSVFATFMIIVFLILDLIYILFRLKYDFTFDLLIRDVVSLVAIGIALFLVFGIYEMVKYLKKQI